MKFEKFPPRLEEASSLVELAGCTEDILDDIKAKIRELEKEQKHQKQQNIAKKEETHRRIREAEYWKMMAGIAFLDWVYRLIV